MQGNIAAAYRIYNKVTNLVPRVSYVKFCFVLLLKIERSSFFTTFFNKYLLFILKRINTLATTTTTTTNNNELFESLFMVGVI